jgi:hypothetical protein
VEDVRAQRAAAGLYASPAGHGCTGVIGRKNHYGSKSQRGTEVAALFYSLIETARLRGEDPGHYLRRAAIAAIENPSTVTLPKAQS